MDRSRRRDAVETRERILRVAAAGWSGPLSFDEIACRAGVSRATVYRHFPDRRALATAIAARGFDALRQATAGDTPFRTLLPAVLATAVSLRRLDELIDSDRVRTRHTRMLIDLLTPAFRRAQADGELRADARPADLDPMLRALLAVADSGPDGDAAALRLLAVLMDGLFGPGVAEPGCTWTLLASK